MSGGPSAASDRSERPTLILATTILASSLSFIDASVVNVGLPAVGRDLRVGGAALAWVINGYTLPLTALLLLGGVLGDVYGRRRLLLYGAASGMMVAIPFILIDARGYSATAAGAALLPLPLTMAVLSPTMGRLAGKTGSRIPLTVGSLIVAVGCFLSMRIGGEGSYWAISFPGRRVLRINGPGVMRKLS